MALNSVNFFFILTGWRLCDDNRVSSVSNEKNIVTRAAYLLFYRRRNMDVRCPQFLPSSSDSDEDCQECVPQATITSETDSCQHEILGKSNVKNSADNVDTKLSACDRSRTQTEQTTTAKLGYTDMDAVD